MHHIKILPGDKVTRPDAYDLRARIIFRAKWSRQMSPRNEMRERRLT
jgi:hypothetical protein